jgi:hypothetical protein
MIGVLFIGSCDACIGCLLTLEVELCKNDPEELESGMARFWKASVI